MIDDEDEWEELGEDYCDAAEQEAIETAEREAEIKRVSDKLIADGENPQGVTLGDYFFAIRAIAKLKIKGLTPDDVYQVLLNPLRTGLSRRTGERICFGKCSKGQAEIVFRATVGKEDKSRALFEVITGFVV